jgi:hypothetical protein
MLLPINQLPLISGVASVFDSLPPHFVVTSQVPDFRRNT